MTRPLKNTWSSVQAVEASFADFDVRPEIVQALADAGITHPFPIQAMTLPVALSGHDIIGQAKTGTGKTLGFGVPLLHRVSPPARRATTSCPTPGKPQALVVVPTRELAVQVAGDLATAELAPLGPRAAGLRRPRVRAADRRAEQRRRRRRRHPGPHDRPAQAAHLDLSRVKAVVLDEADEMLDLGFLPDVETLLARHAREPPHDAVLGDHAGRRRRDGPPLHDAADAHPRRRPGRRRPDRQEHQAGRLPRARAGQGRDARPHPAGRAAAA